MKKSDALKQEVFDLAQRIETAGSEFEFGFDDVCLKLSAAQIDAVMEDWNGTDREEFKKSSFLGFEIVERKR